VFDLQDLAGHHSSPWIVTAEVRMTAPPPEVWLRGAVPGIPALLAPVAHALLQAREDVERLATGLAPGVFRAMPGGAASVAFHLFHASGSLDRLFTYARGEALSPDQRTALAAERAIPESVDAAALVERFGATVERALAQLRGSDPARILDPRAVGRAALPSTVLGLLFHAAEHTTRHVGQAITTAKAAAA
jgi:DinB superfamily